jgi:hypothetical protein
MQRKISVSVDGGPSAGSCVRRPGREEIDHICHPYLLQKNALIIF